MCDSRPINMIDKFYINVEMFINLSKNHFRAQSSTHVHFKL